MSDEYPRHGWVVPIGGGEERDPRGDVLRRFARLCGGRDAKLVVIPTASMLKDTGPNYAELFDRMGVDSTKVLAFGKRSDCEDPKALQTIEECTGVFITGGNQLRLSTVLGGTPVATRLRERNREGLVVGGTSAGAAILSEHMIGFGDEGQTPRGGMVSMAPGLGLFPEAVVDQHFGQRSRLGRLLTAVANNPRLFGIGIDEDTAAFVGPDKILEVVGSGAVTVLDTSEVEYSSIHRARHGEPVSISTLKLSVLVEGDRFDLEARRALPTRRSPE